MYLVECLSWNLFHQQTKFLAISFEARVKWFFFFGQTTLYMTSSSSKKDEGFDFNEWSTAIRSRAGSALETARGGLQRLQTTYSRTHRLVSSELQDQFRNGITREHAAGATIALSLVGSAFLGRVAIQRMWLRYTTALDIPMSLVERGLKLRGVVVRVPDGDGLRIWHTPRIKWFFERWRIPKDAKKSAQSIYVC